MKRWLAMGAVVLLSALACGKDKQAPAPASSSQPSASASGQSADKGGKGLTHPDNEAEIVKLAEAALKCPWKDSTLQLDCPAFKAFTSADAVKTGKGDATFLNMLSDARKEVRWLAAKGLDRGMIAPWHKSKPVAKRVLAAAAAEKEELIGYSIGRLAGMIDVQQTGTAEDVKKLIAEAKSVEVRRGILSNVLFNNRKAEGFYDLVAKMARKHDSAAIRVAAAKAFWSGGRGRKEDTCKLWLELISDAHDELAGLSAYHCAWWATEGGCIDQWDGLLDALEARAKAGTVNTTFMSSSLSWLRKQQKASAAQKKRALKIIEKIAENEANGKMARADALRLIVDEAPKGSAFVKKFTDDKDPFVQGTAKRLLDKKGKKGTAPKKK